MAQAATQSPAALHLEVPTDIDLSTLSAYLSSTSPPCSVDPPSLSEPTPELILHLYRTFLQLFPAAGQAQNTINELRAELERERSERTRKEVETEGLLNDAEGRVTEAAAERDQEKEKREQAEREKAAATLELQSVRSDYEALKSSTASSSSDASALRESLDKVEREKRSIVVALDREREEATRRDEELEALTARNREARQEVSRLSTELQDAKSAEGTAKFKAQSLEQELQLKNKDNEWLNSELTSKTEEFAKYRQDKHAEIVKLQTDLDVAQQNAASASASLTSLQTLHKSTSDRLTDSLAKITELNGRLADQDEEIRHNKGMIDRYMAKTEELRAEEKKRVDHVLGEWEAMNERWRQREEKLKEEIAAETARREAGEAKQEEYRDAMERMADGLEALGVDVTPYTGSTPPESQGPPGASAPSTPTPGGSALPGEPLRASTPAGARAVASSHPVLTLSPTASLASKLQKSGRSYTEIYTDYVRIQGELVKEKADSRKLEEALTTMLRELEERAPLLLQQKEEYIRVSSELNSLIATHSEVVQKSASLEQELKEQGRQAETFRRENALLEQQVSDLARQVRFLTRELSIRDNPSLELSLRAEEDSEAMADIEAGGGPNVEDVITVNLLTYRSLAELQQQNQKLLRITRELGQRMEMEEEEFRNRMGPAEAEAVQEAHETILKLRSELEDAKLKAESFKRERDMYAETVRRQASSSGAPGATSSMSTVAVTEGGDANTEGPNYQAMYTELQANFDAFRDEIGVDTQKLRDDLRDAQRESGRHQVNVAKANAQIDFLNERLRIITQTEDMRKNELAEITKRGQHLQDNLTRQEIAAHRVTEELVEMKGSVDRLRNENANLRAEKELWKSVEARLLEENRNIAKERANLSDVIHNLQSMQNEVERSGNEAKRRLENQVMSLESQCHELRDQLKMGLEHYHQLSLRHEVDIRDTQSRIDKANTDLATAREALAVAKTNETHLQARVDDLVKQLDSKDEKLSVYERRKVPSGEDGGSQAQAGLSREQELEIELAEVRGELKAAQVEAAQAMEHMEQFKAIAQANEAALSQMNADYDEYKASTDSSLQKKEAELQSLQERLSNALSEVNNATTESSELRRELETQKLAFDKEKRLLEDAIADLSKVEERVRDEQLSIQEDIRKQAEIAKEAQDKYERELVAHAEDVKLLTQLKEQTNEIQARVREHQTAAETAQANLASSQASWEAQKQGMAKEAEELRKRVEDLTHQNDILHNQLEQVTAQASRIREAATQSGATATSDVEAAATGRAPKEELQEVIRYLRREKELSDLQIELKRQDEVRLRQRLEHAYENLNAVRLQLVEEQQRAADSTGSAAQHAELIDKINQLNVLRESNTTLREESERHSRRAAQLEAQLRNTTAELDPIKEQLRNAQAELETREQQIRLVEEDNQRWKSRTQQILQKYERIDPAELQNLEERAKAAEERAQLAEQARDEAVKAKEALESEVENVKSMDAKLRTILEQYKERYNALQKDARERFANFNKQIADLKAENEKLKKELEERIGQQQVANETALNELRAERDRLQQEKERLESEKAQLQTAQPPAESQEQALEEAKKAWEEEKQKLEAAIAKERQEKEGQQEVPNETVLNELRAERDRLQQEKERLESEKAQLQTAQPPAESQEQALEEAKKAWEEEKQKLEAAVAKEIQEKEVIKEKSFTAFKSNKAAQAKIKELEEALKVASEGASQDKLESDYEAICKTALQHDEAVKAAVQSALEQVQATTQATETPAAAPAVDVEAIVQERLAAAQEEREKEKEAAVQNALANKEKETKAHTETAVANVRKELDLRYRMKDNQMEKLRAKVKDLEEKLKASSGAAQTAPVTTADGGAPATALAGAPPATTSAPISAFGAGPVSASPFAAMPATTSAMPAVASAFPVSPALSTAPAVATTPATSSPSLVPTSLPGKPQDASVGAVTTPQAGQQQQQTQGGGISIRGGARGRGGGRGRGRGGGHQAGGQAGSASSSPAPSGDAGEGGTTPPMGGKRQREDAQAEGQAQAGAEGGDHAAKRARGGPGGGNAGGGNAGQQGGASTRRTGGILTRLGAQQQQQQGGQGQGGGEQQGGGGA